MISPLCQQAESRNLGQTFLANSVDSPRKPLRRRPREVMNDAGRKEGTSLSAHFVKQWAAVPLPPMHNNEAYYRTATWGGGKKWTETSLTKRTIFIQMKQGCAAMRKRMWVEDTDPYVRGWPSKCTTSYTFRYLVRPYIEYVIPKRTIDNLV